MSLSASEVKEIKKAPAVEGVLPAILHRWSPRSYTDKTVSLETLGKIFAAARWSASSSNEQPWRFLVGLKGDATYEKIFSTLVPFNQAWAGKAPVLILGVASTKFAKNGEENAYALYDLGAAVSLLTVQATDLGVAAHSMGGFDHAAALAAFEIPAGYVVGAVTTLGYQGEPADLGHEKMIAMEEAPRERKPLSEIVLSAWGVPAKL
jgi:nitroreductase